MNDGKPSTPLMVVLAGCIALAGWMYGLPLITGSDDPVEDEFIEPTDLGFVDDEPETEIETWTPPESPRDPFLPVELGTLDGAVEGGVEGAVDGDIAGAIDGDREGTVEGDGEADPTNDPGAG